MSALIIATVVFICCFGAALAGMVLHVKVPDHQLDGDSKEVVKLVMGLIATMAALVLSLLIASAKSSYDTQATELQQISANIVQLDGILELYGPETKEIRSALRQTVMEADQRIWHADQGAKAIMDSSHIRDGAALFYAKLHGLSPTNGQQRSAIASALQIGSALGHTRILMFEQSGDSIPWLLEGILLFWVSMLFMGFGLFARSHVTIIAAFLVGAISVASATFLILELSQPYDGMMRLSDAPLRSALAIIDQ